MQPDEMDSLPEEPAGLVPPEPAEQLPAMESHEAIESTAVPAEVVAEPPPERKPFWGYLDLALVLGLLIAAFVVISIVGALVVVMKPKLQADPTPLLVPANLAIYLALYLSFKIAFKLRYKRPVFRSLGWKKTTINLALVGLGGVLLAFGISGLAALIHTPKIPTPFDKLIGSPTQMVIFGLMAVVLAPLFEELFFRGFIQPLLVRSLGAVAGIVLTAAMFGSLHLVQYSWAWQYALFISLAGAIFGWLRYRTDSIIPSTVMHGCFNAVSVVALFFGKNI